MDLVRFSKWMAIGEICRQEFPSNRTDCNAFVKAVASRLGVSLTGNANAITLAIRQAPWTKLDSPMSAIHAAAQGKFVVAGIQGGEMKDAMANGHVAVVVSGAPDAKGFPMAYSGQLGGLGWQNLSIRQQFFATDLDSGAVTYAALSWDTPFA